MHTDLVHPILWTLAKVLSLPIALGAVAVARNGLQSLDILPIPGEPLVVEGGTIRTRLMLENPTQRNINVERIVITVTDCLGTFTLRNETAIASIPPDSRVEVELLATNFQALRLSRQCTLRARLFDRSGQLCMFTRSFENVWPAEHFGDCDTETAFDSFFPAHGEAASINGRPYRRIEEIRSDSRMRL